MVSIRPRATFLHGANRICEHSRVSRLLKSVFHGRAALVCGAVLLSILLGGCGLKTSPRPSEDVIPPLVDLRGRARPEGILLSWPVPSGFPIQRFGEVETFILTLEHQPVYCDPCPSSRREEVILSAGADAIRPEGNRLFHFHPVEGGAALVRVRIAAIFGAGRNNDSLEQRVERRPGIAAPTLQWRWIQPIGKSSSKTRGEGMIQFFWTPEQEGFRRVHGTGGEVSETVRIFRGNLYRRVPPEPWPFTPMNETPLEGSRWTLPAAVLGPQAEFRLRLVDRNGGEGPPSNSITLTGKSRS